MKILFGVFDWGLGHATRDLPLIEALLKRHEVDILSTGRALQILQQRFGTRCRYFDVPSLIVPYGRSRFFMPLFIARIPNMLIDLVRARRKSAAIIAQHKYDVVISDCRYDVYDRPENSFLINHQLRFKLIPGIELIAEAWLAYRESRFGTLIVPDFPGSYLTGKLSSQLHFIDSQKIQYIGAVSQLQQLPLKKDIDYFISISGPEPQRTVLEERVLAQLHKLQGTIVVTLGKPELGTVTQQGRATIYSFLSTNDQERMMNRAKCVVTRSGYTTMMELHELGIRHALLIPTPGQTEQEYLADLYTERGDYVHVDQDELNLVRDTKHAATFNGFQPQWKTKESVKRFVHLIERVPSYFSK